MCFSDLTIKGIDAIINPKNNEFISYIFFSNIYVINNTDSINPVIQPIPIFDKNLIALILSNFDPDIILFNEFTNYSDR